MQSHVLQLKALFGLTHRSPTRADGAVGRVGESVAREVARRAIACHVPWETGQSSAVSPRGHQRCHVLFDACFDRRESLPVTKKFG